MSNASLLRIDASLGARSTQRDSLLREGDRKGAALLLCAALRPYPPARGRDLLRAIWFGALDVRVPGSWALSVQSATGMGIPIGDCLHGLGERRGDDVSVVPLVCRAQAAPQRPLAELSLIAPALAK